MLTLHFIMLHSVYPFIFMVPKILQYFSVCSFCARSHTTEQSTKWKLATAVCVERYPVITQEMNEIEKKYKDLMTKREIENSLLSAHEEQLRKDQ